MRILIIASVLQCPRVATMDNVGKGIVWYLRGHLMCSFSRLYLRGHIMSSCSRLYDVDGDGVASKSEVEHITKVS